MVHWLERLLSNLSKFTKWQLLSLKMVKSCNFFWFVLLWHQLFPSQLEINHVIQQSKAREHVDHHSLVQKVALPAKWRPISLLYHDFVRNHPYIMSAYFWPFWTKYTHLISNRQHFSIPNLNMTSVFFKSTHHVRKHLATPIHPPFLLTYYKYGP